jgi:hypothetical protein
MAFDSYRFHYFETYTRNQGSVKAMNLVLKSKIVVIKITLCKWILRFRQTGI